MSKGAQPVDSRSVYPVCGCSGAAAAGDAGAGDEEDILACSSVVTTNAERRAFIRWKNITGTEKPTGNESQVRLDFANEFADVRTGRWILE
jgi:hypothetical protein